MISTFNIIISFSFSFSFAIFLFIRFYYKLRIHIYLFVIRFSGKEIDKLKQPSSSLTPIVIIIYTLLFVIFFRVGSFTLSRYVLRIEIHWRWTSKRQVHSDLYEIWPLIYFSGIVCIHCVRIWLFLFLIF